MNYDPEANLRIEAQQNKTIAAFEELATLFPGLAPLCSTMIDMCDCLEQMRIEVQECFDPVEKERLELEFARSVFKVEKLVKGMQDRIKAKQEGKN